MKKLIVILLILILTGCDYKELSDLSIGTVLGIDKKEDKYIVTALIVSQNEGETHLFEGQGTSITAAIDNLNLNLTENLYLNHLQSLVIETNVAKEGMKNILNYFLKNKEIDRDFYMFLAHNNSSSEILKHLLDKSNGNYNSITNIFKTHDEIKYTDNSNSFSSFLNTILKDGIEPTLNSLTIKNNTLIISDIGVFKKDKLIEYIDSNIGYASLNSTAKQVTLNIPCQNKNTVLVIENIKTTTKTHNKHIINNISGNIKLKENNCKFKTRTDEEKKKIENLTSLELEKLVDKTIKQSKKINSDIFGYKEFLYKNYENTDINYNDLKITNKIKLSTKNIESSDAYHE